MFFLYRSHIYFLQTERLATQHSVRSNTLEITRARWELKKDCVFFSKIV